MDELKTVEIKSSMAEIFINLLSFILLGIIATATGIIYFQVINKYFPDVLSAFYRSYQVSGFEATIIRYSIASLIVGFPIYFWTIWFWFRSFDPSVGGLQKIESKLPKWLTYVALLIAGGTIIGDLITIVYNFLQGEYGSRFLLKSLVILVIAGLVFGFYFLERKKIQYKKEVKQIYFWFISVFAVAIIVLAIILGFAAGGTPRQVRLMNLDLQRVGNLEQISSCVSNFAYDNGKLPANLVELKNNARYSYCASKTSDPEANRDYEYAIISEKEYELCAEFSLSTLGDFQNGGYYSLWAKHDKGRVCNKQTATTRGLKPIPMPAVPQISE